MTLAPQNPGLATNSQHAPAPVESETAFGGTPDPATLLLLAGGALGYGAVRLRRRRTAAQTENS